MLTEVNKGRMTLNHYVRVASENPAKVWQMYPKKGAIRLGSDGDVTIVDMNKEDDDRWRKTAQQEYADPLARLEGQGHAGLHDRARARSDEGWRTGRQGNRSDANADRELAEWSNWDSGEASSRRSSSAARHRVFDQIIDVIEGNFVDRPLHFEKAWRRVLLHRHDGGFDRRTGRFDAGDFLDHDCSVLRHIEILPQPVSDLIERVR